MGEKGAVTKSNVGRVSQAVNNGADAADLGKLKEERLLDAKQKQESPEADIRGVREGGLDFLLFARSRDRP